MTDIFNFPQYRTVYYGFNPETGYYTKSEKQAEKTPVMRLPYELRLPKHRQSRLRQTQNISSTANKKRKTAVISL